MQKLELIKIGLQTIIDNIDNGNSNASDEELDATLDMITKVTDTRDKLSKYQACKYLKMSRAKFDNHVRAGDIPRGRKEQGFKELFWLKSDLDKINLEN